MARGKRVVEREVKPITSNTGQVGRRVIKIPKLTFEPDKGLFVGEDDVIYLCLASLHLFDKNQQKALGQEILRRINGE